MSLFSDISIVDDSVFKFANYKQVVHSVKEMKVNIVVIG